jgi:hypothetical protein
VTQTAAAGSRGSFERLSFNNYPVVKPTIVSKIPKITTKDHVGWTLKFNKAKMTTHTGIRI